MSWAVGLIATVLIAAVPWAFSMQANVAAIKAQLEHVVGRNTVRIDQMDERLDDIERRVP